MCMCQRGLRCGSGRCIGSGDIHRVRVVMVVVALAVCGGRGGGSRRSCRKESGGRTMQCRC